MSLLIGKRKYAVRAVFSFLNPGVFVVIAKLQKAEIRLCPFPEPPNSGGALAPPAPPLNTALFTDHEKKPYTCNIDFGHRRYE